MARLVFFFFQDFASHHFDYIKSKFGSIAPNLKEILLIFLFLFLIFTLLIDNFYIQLPTMTVSREKEQSAVPEVGSVVCIDIPLRNKKKLTITRAIFQMVYIYINSTVYIYKDYR